MPRVFSRWEIEKNHVPTQQQILETKDNVLNAGRKLVEQGKADGLRLYGSTAVPKRVRETSDIDLMMITPHGQQIHQQLIAVGAKDNVRISPVIRSREQVATRAHSFDEYMLTDLASYPQEGNVIGQDPLKTWTPYTNRPEIIVADYVLTQQRKLDPFRIVSAEELLETAIGIYGTLPYPGLSFYYNGDTQNLVGKTQVRETFLQKLASDNQHNLAKALNVLCLFQEQYQNLLQLALKGEISYQTYAIQLQKLSQLAGEQGRYVIAEFDRLAAEKLGSIYQRTYSRRLQEKVKQGR